MSIPPPPLQLEKTPIKPFKIININNLLEEFYIVINKFELKNIICIDETSFNAFLIRKYGYSKKGTRCIIQTNNQNVFKKYTGIFAMTISDIYFTQFIKKVVWIVID